MILGRRNYFDNDIVNTLCEDKFTDYLVTAIQQRESQIILTKRFKVEATPEFANLFRNSITKSRKSSPSYNLDENDKFFQYMRSEIKRTRKEMEEENKGNSYEIKFLLQARSELEEELKGMAHQLDLYKKDADENMDYKGHA